MVIVIQSIVDGCDTNAQGAIVQTMLRKYLSQQATVTLDFSGVFNVTSSFVNTAFVELLGSGLIKLAPKPESGEFYHSKKVA
ncbi:MAG: STAS-like domain-containing protein [Rhodobacteraceae bacterium]|nr:STAS-like domain-containing protein [Paracoccaceae bacterium]